VSTLATTASDELVGYDDIGLEGGPLPDTRELPAWLVSLGVHVLLLVVFWMVRLSTSLDADMEITSKVEPQVKKDLRPTIRENQEIVGTNTNAETQTAAQRAALQRGRDPQKDFDRELQQDNLVLLRPEPEPIQQPKRDELVAPVQANGNTMEVGGTEGALDVLTREIEGKLRDRKTMVVWLFDASQSLKERRNFIADRFKNVYSQLEARNNNVYDVLKTAVVSYGSKTTFLTEEPVDRVEDVVGAVRNIKPDKTGKEYVFTAIANVLGKWQHLFLKYRSATSQRRNVMFIVVTDERGDDYNGKNGEDLTYLDRVIGQLRRFNINVYCVGNAAVFGREKGRVSFTDETGYQWKSLPVDQGPETVAPQRLQLPFWNGTPRSVRRLSANFGPYALTRLCMETGGLYLITEHSVGATTFPRDVMRKYRPFYGPIPAYLQQLKNNKAKLALDTVARMTLEKSIPKPQREFRADSEQTLRRQITEAQRPFAVLNHRLNRMLAVLKDGKQDASKLQSDRWRAAFHLAIGRLYATHVRSYGYQTMLAEMSSSPHPFKNKDSNQWRLVPSNNWKNYTPRVRKKAQAAIKHLSYVIDNHPDTPWALLAQHELAGGKLGWEWREARGDYSRGRGNGNNPDRLQLANEDDPDPKKKKMRKKKRKPPQL